MSGQPFVHPGPAKFPDVIPPFDPTAPHPATTTSPFVGAIKKLVKVEAERDAARHAWHEASITIMRRTNVAVRLEQIVAEQDATIERIKALLNEPWCVRAVDGTKVRHFRGVRTADLRAALKEPL